MDNNKKIKVVWLCHFSNKATRERMKLSTHRFFYRLIKKIINEEAKNIKYGDFAPWISVLIDQFEKFSDVELHIISPQIGLKGILSEFEINQVYYHFYNPNVSLFLSKFIKNVNLWLKLQPNSFIVKKILKKIKPDIVNLIGAENYYHSCVMLYINKIPVLTTCQTIYSNPKRLEINPDANKSKNWEIELKIHSKGRFFGCGGRMHRDLLLRNNPNAIIFDANLPSKMPIGIDEQVKEYDFVCFASRHSEKKGTHDAIKALAIVKSKVPEVKLNIVGKISFEVREELDLLIKHFNLESNIIFHEYFDEHDDMFRQVMKARFAILPVKMDDIPSTVREAMYLGIPVVTYITTGTPMLNRDKECVLLSEIGNIDKLADNMCKLINSKSLAEKIARNGQEYFDNHFNSSEEAEKLKSIYYAIINNHKCDTIISDSLLFNPVNYPVYSMYI